MKKQLQNWILSLIAVGTVIGGIIGQTIIYYMGGDFNFSSTLGFLTGAAVLIIINIFKVFLKKDKTPDVDERTRHNSLTFFAYSSNIFIGLLFIALTVISFTDMDYISLKYLWIIMIAYLWMIGIGGFVVRRR